MHLFLDDERKPGDVKWIVIPDASYHIVRNYQEFREVLYKAEHIDHVSFDHDLGFGNGVPDTQCATGYDCAKLLIDWCIARGVKLPSYTVHSMNPVGKKNIEQRLERFRQYQEMGS